MLAEAGCLDEASARDEAVIGRDEARRRVVSDPADPSPFVYDVQNHSQTVLFKLPLLRERVQAYTRLVGSERFVRFFGELMGGAAEAPPPRPPRQAPQPALR